MADPIALPPQAPKALQDQFNKFVSEDLWRFASDGAAPKHQLRQYLKENPEVLKHTFTGTDGNQTNIIVELIRLEKDQLAIMMLDEFELPKSMIAGHDADAAAVDKTPARWQGVSSPLEMALKKGQTGLAKKLVEKGADAKRVTHGDTHLLQLASMNGSPSLLEMIDKKLPAEDMQALLVSYSKLPVNMRERPSLLVPLLEKHKIAKEDKSRFAAKWEHVFTQITHDKRNRNYGIETQHPIEPFIPPVTYRQWVDEFAVRDMTATMLALQKNGLANAPAEKIGKTLIGFTGSEFEGPLYLEQLKTLASSSQKLKDNLLAEALGRDEVTAAKMLIKEGAKGQAQTLFEAIWAEKPQTVDLLLESGVRLDSVNSSNVGAPPESNNKPILESTLIYHWSSKAKFETILRTLANKGLKPKDDASYFQAVEIALSDPKKAALIGILQQNGLPFPAQGKNNKDLIEIVEGSWAAENAEWAKNNPGLDRFTNDPAFPQLLIDRANLKNALKQWKAASPQRENGANVGSIQLDNTFQLADGTAAPVLPLDMEAMKKQVKAA